MGKGEYDLSEMFVVHHTMMDRGVNYVRYHGDSSFSPGGSFYDIMFCLRNYGLVPQEAMPGIMYGDTLPVHNELDAVAGAYVNAIAKGKLTKLTPVWKKGLALSMILTSASVPKTSLTKEKNILRRHLPNPRNQSGRLHISDFIYPPSILHSDEHRNSGQLAQRPFL